MGADLKVVPEIPVQEEPEIINELYKEFEDNVDMVDNYCKTRGVFGGLDVGFPQMTHALEGLQPGIILIAGQPNVGKSALVLQMALQVAKTNEKVYCMYHSIDDNIKEMLPRAVATLAKVPINSIKFPQKLEQEGQFKALERREKALNEIKQLSDRFGIRDSLYNGEGADIESIEQSIKNIKMSLPDDVRICLFIDNFHDLNSKTIARSDSEAKRYEYICEKLTSLANNYDMAIVCTAELKKLNGNRRPTIEDVRESVKISYEAKAILLCYNEVGLKGENANIYWDDPGKEGKQPVLEVHFGKNKLSSFKNRLFYSFWPEMSRLEETSPDGAKLFRGKIQY